MKQIHIIYLVLKGLVQSSCQRIIEWATPWRRSKPFTYRITEPVEELDEKIDERYRPELIRNYINTYNPPNKL